MTDERVIPGKRLGRHVNHDSRSLRYLVGNPATAIASVEYERVAAVFDQGALGSCTGNAAVGALGTHPLYDALRASDQTNLVEDFAVTVYSKATEIDPYPGQYPRDDTGSDGLSVAKVLKAYGLIAGYLHATSLTAMQAALQTTPVIVGVNWYEGFDNPDPDGLVSISGDVRGGHEFEVLGMDVDRQLFHAVNSWGTGWGKSGHFRFSFTDMTRLLRERGDCTQLLPLTAPAPTPTPVDAADRELIPAMDAWAATIFSRLTKAGKAKAAYETWKQAKGV